MNAQTKHTPVAMDAGCVNTDKELWREREGDYYADSIHVTENGCIGINHGGHVYVAPLARWHEAIRLADQRAELLGLLQELIDIEGPQPGTDGWADKVRSAIIRATGEQP